MFPSLLTGLVAVLDSELLWEDLLQEVLLGGLEVAKVERAEFRYHSSFSEA